MDVVLIDTPPMAANADGEYIAHLADAALLVVRQDRAPVRVLNDTIDVIKNAGAELIGCVLNNYYVADYAESISYGVGGEYGYGSKYGLKYGYGYAGRQGYAGRYEYGAGYGQRSKRGEEGRNE